jgi:hypothetical protein
VPFWRRPPDLRPALEVGISGLQRHREWDVVVTVEASLEVEGTEFVALPDGRLLTAEGVSAHGLAPLAQAVERSLRPPYRAEAVKRDGGLWAVAANAIHVVEIPEEMGGNEIELAVQEGHHTLLVDGDRVLGSVPTLQELAGARHRSYVVHAERLDGKLWEVRVAPL